MSVCRFGNFRDRCRSGRVRLDLIRVWGGFTLDYTVADLFALTRLMCLCYSGLRTLCTRPGFMATISIPSIEFGDRRRQCKRVHDPIDQVRRRRPLFYI
jgi:hypothetical protein